MDEFPSLNPGSVGITGINVPDKEKFLVELAQLLKKNKGSELVGTFQAGCIPVMLDTLARDTSEAGQNIVTAMYKMITDLKTYYATREEGSKEEKPDEEEEDKKKKSKVGIAARKPEG